MGEDTPLISVIVLNYNGKQHIDTCLQSVVHQSMTGAEVLVVDNGSTDGSWQFAQSAFPGIRVMHSPVNSFAAGNNVGINNAKGRFLFFLNNDTELDKHCIRELAAAISSSPESMKMWAPKILNFYQRTEIDSAGLAIYPDGLSRGRGRLERDGGVYDIPSEVCFPSGCAAVYDREILSTIGGFDERFKFFVEDSDLGFRARLAGATCGYIPSARVYHKYSATTGRYSSRKAFLAERNRIWLALKLFPWRLIAINPWFSVKRFAYQLFGIFTHRGAAGKYVQRHSLITLFGVTVAAWTAAIWGVPAMLFERSRIRRFRKVNTSEIIRWFSTFGISARELALKE